MRIVKIMEDNAGFKLIAAENAVNHKCPNVKFPKGYKHSGIGTVFFDYKNGELRQFFGSRFDAFKFDNAKQAYKYIFSL